MNIVVLLAGGNGSRVKGTTHPKQYIKVAGKMIIEHTIEAYQSSDDIDAIVLVVSDSYIENMSNIVKSYSKVIRVVKGGETRILSVLNAVIFLDGICKACDKIIVSDAVRPLVQKKDIRNIIEELNNYESVTTGIECYETLFKSDSSMETEFIIDRDMLYRQTSPEGYKFGILKFLYINTEKEAIDSYKNIGLDRMISLGKKVKIIKCSSYNFKVTTDEDMKIIEALILSGFLKSI